MMNMLGELEGDMLKMLSLSRSDLIPLDVDQDLQPTMSNLRLSGTTGEARLYQRLEVLAKEMH
jgi:hypothetical protein